ncbi:MAG: methionine--tRNA ligase [Spirochaetia bacterium]|nr:methionine--tRNA ligase [Spirochaetia bacterium]
MSKNKEKYYISTPIYYVNSHPHIGHAYTTIACDTMARYQKLLGKDVFFLTGTDEHGDKIVKAATQSSKTPEEYTNEISNEFKKTWENLHICNDDFIRTTEERHKKVVQTILNRIYDKGDIYLSEYEGKYCTGCERYLTEKELTEEGKCPDHQKKPDIIKEENYFFKMQKYLPIWEDILKKNPDKVRPERYYNEVLATIKELISLEDDLSISRPKKRLDWGIELPFDKEYVTYVWFDALINYISGIGFPDDEKYKTFWPNSRHMIAKDILKPHAIYWPVMLLAADIPVYKQLQTHGYWLGWGDMKMSKTLGNAMEPVSLSEKIGEDSLRFFLMREMSFGSDSRFNEEILYKRLNQDLSNDLGNLLQRTLSMIKKYFEGEINISEKEHSCAGEINELFKKKNLLYHENFEKFHFHRAIEEIFEIIRRLNQLIEEKKPWAMAKENKIELSAFLHTLLKAISGTLFYLKPVLPNKTNEILNLLKISSQKNFPESIGDIILENVTLDTWPIYFPRFQVAADSI